MVFKKFGLTGFKQCAVSLLLFVIPSRAFASSDVSTITTALRAIVDMLTGTAATLVATAAVAAVGYRWLISHKMNMKEAGMCGLGIALIFGSAQIVSLLGGGSV